VGSKRNRNRLPAGTPDVRIVQQTHQEFRAGPLPDPEDLARFDQVVPGLANRIVGMAEENQKDRLRSNATMRRTIAMGQVFAFIVSISAIGAGTYLASLGHNNQGIAAIVIALGFPIASFLYRRVTGR